MAAETTRSFQSLLDQFETLKTSPEAIAQAPVIDARAAELSYMVRHLNTYAKLLEPIYLINTSPERETTDESEVAARLIVAKTITHLISDFSGPEPIWLADSEAKPTSDQFGRNGLFVTVSLGPGGNQLELTDIFPWLEHEQNVQLAIGPADLPHL